MYFQLSDLSDISTANCSHDSSISTCSSNLLHENHSTQTTVTHEIDEQFVYYEKKYTGDLVKNE